MVEPTAGRFGCRRKNVDNKPRHVDVCTRRQFVQHNGCKRLRILLHHSSRIISDEKRRVGGLSQQQKLDDMVSGTLLMYVITITFIFCSDFVNVIMTIADHCSCDLVNKMSNFFQCLFLFFTSYTPTVVNYNVKYLITFGVYLNHFNEMHVLSLIHI